MRQIDPEDKKLRGPTIHWVVDTWEVPPPDQHILFYAYHGPQEYHLRDHQADIPESK